VTRANHYQRRLKLLNLPTRKQPSYPQFGHPHCTVVLDVLDVLNVLEVLDVWMFWIWTSTPYGCFANSTV